MNRVQCPLLARHVYEMRHEGALLPIPPCSGRAQSGAGATTTQTGAARVSFLDDPFTGEFKRHLKMQQEIVGEMGSVCHNSSASLRLSDFFNSYSAATHPLSLFLKSHLTDQAISGVTKNPVCWSALSFLIGIATHIPIADVRQQQGGGHSQTEPGPVRRPTASSSAAGAGEKVPSTHDAFPQSGEDQRFKRMAIDHRSYNLQ